MGLEKSLENLTLVLGGAASGKTAYAEGLALKSGLDRVYVATARAHDAEMKEKIEAHRQARGDGWTTVEAPFDPGQPLDNATHAHVILIDCATLWLTNLLLEEREPAPAEDALLHQISATAAKVIIVSNDLAGGIVPADAFSRRFRNLHGKMNQRLASRAAHVAYVIAGLPQMLKGRQA